MSKIFISYRKEDSQKSATSLHSVLIYNFGIDSVFYDSECIQGGDEWRKKLEEGVNSSTVVLILIENTPKWLGEERIGNRVKYRIDSESDWVRNEILLAQKARKTIIPVLIDNATLPEESELPSELQFLVGLQYPEPIKSNYFNKDVQNLLNDLEKLGIARVTNSKITDVPTQNKLKLQPYHRYTCDRSYQYKIFEELLIDKTRSRHHFYYLYGGEGQEPDGIFNRFSIRAKGVHLDFLSSSATPDSSVCNFRVVVPKVDDLNSLSIDLPSLILVTMGISQPEIDKMPEKTLAEGLRLSPSTCKIGCGGKVLFHFIIKQIAWEKNLIVKLTREFVNDFCLKNLKDETPELFFFFSVEFEEDKSETVLNELNDVLRDAQFLKSMNELGMVKKEDVDEWFHRHSVLWDGTRKQKMAKEKYFGNNGREMYMDDVHTILDKLISDLNNDEKNESRH
jgi:hypothetical protein